MGQPAVLEKIQDAEQGDSHHNGSFDPDPGSDFYFLEFNGPEWQGRGRAYLGFFIPVCNAQGLRDLTRWIWTAMSEPRQLLTAILMLIGGSPGSTAGGMKTTTLAVPFAVRLGSILPQGGYAVLRAAYFRGNRALCGGCNDDVYHTLYRRRALLSVICKAFPILTCIYEAASAIATVGLTLGITPELGTIITDHTDSFNVLRKSRRTDTGLCGYFRSEASCFKVAPGKDYCGIKKGK